MLDSNAVSKLDISAAMCTFNGEAYLEQQLLSIREQVCPPSELIVCDDGSTDGTLDLLDTFSQSSSFPVRIYRNSERLGPSRNFEKAIALCSCQMIVLSDQDDIWEHNKLSVLRRAIEENPDASYIFSNAQMIDQDGKMLGITLFEALSLRLPEFAGSKQLRRLLKANVVTGAGVAFLSSFRDIILPIPDGWMHDYWLALIGSAIGDAIAIPDVLYRYRRHSAQFCGWKKGSTRQRLEISFGTTGQTAQQKVREFQLLLERLDLRRDKNLLAARVSLLKEKEFHLVERARARSSRGLSRIGRVLSEAASGRYGRFSQSLHSIARDLMPQR